MKAAIIAKVLYILIIIGCVGLYIYQVVVLKVPPTQNLVRFLLILGAAVIGLIRSNYPRRRNSLEVYEKSYAKELRTAFSYDEAERKNLLRAARFYDENNPKKSVKLLMDLKNKCRRPDDHFAVDLFLALNFTEMHFYEDALHEYEQICSRRMENSTIYNNMGHIYLRMGKKKDAMDCFAKSLALSDDNAITYVNLANLHFEERELDSAIRYAKKALDINSNLKQASSLLAIAYAMQKNQEQSEKYFHKAVACGYRPKELKKAIKYYTESM